MTVHPVIFFILTVIFSLPVILIGGKRLYELHKIVYGSKANSRSTAEFFHLAQNHPIIAEPQKIQGRASPDLNALPESDIKGSLDKLMTLLFRARLPKDNGQAKGSKTNISQTNQARSKSSGIN